MSDRTSKHTLEQRLNAVLKIINGTHSINQVSNELRINSKTLSLWISKYKKRGITGLEESHSWKKYSEDIKRKAVLDYLNNHLSLLECCQKYDISSDSVLRSWIKQYTDGKTLKTTGGSTKMKASRNTTYNERLEIVHYTLANNKNYREAAEKYQVSYSQIYNWVRKYEQNGQEGLVDRRGRKIQETSLDKLSNEEKLERRIKELEAHNQDLAAENFLLKKLTALEKASRK